MASGSHGGASGAGGGMHLSDILTKGQQRILSDFSADDFDQRKYLENVLSSSRTPQLLEDLNIIIQNISWKIHSHVGSHHGQLLKQAEHIREVDKELKEIRARVNELHSIFTNSRNRVIKPYEGLKTKVQQLEFLQVASQLSSQTLRVVSKTHNLRSQLRAMEAKDASARESVKAARLIRDIEEVFGETDLSQIDIVDQIKPFLTTAAKRVSQHSGTKITKSMKALNQLEIGTYLQAFLYLGELKPSIDRLLLEIQTKTVSRIREALDISRIGDAKSGANKEGKKTASVLRSALWKRLDVATQHIFDAGVSVYNLQQVIIKKRDPATYKSFLDTYLSATSIASGVPPSLVKRLWEGLLKGLSDELKRAYKSSTFVRKVVVNEFPRLQYLFRSLLRRLKQATSPVLSFVQERRRQSLLLSLSSESSEKARDMTTAAPDKDSEKEGGGEGEIDGGGADSKIQEFWYDDVREIDLNAALKKLLSTYEIAYLKVLIDKLNHPIKTMFSGASSGRYPNPADAHLFLTTVQSSLRGVRLSTDELKTQVANRVKQGVNMLLARCEEYVQLKALAGKPIPRRNHQIYKTLAEIANGFYEILHTDEDNTTQGSEKGLPNSMSERRGSASSQTNHDAASAAPSSDPNNAKELLNNTIKQPSCFKLPTRGLELLNEAHNSNRALRHAILEVLVSKAKAQCVSLTLEVHSETMNRPNAHRTASKYMRRIQRWSETFTRDTLSRYKVSNPCPEIMQEMGGIRFEVGAYVTKVFMRNVSLISGLREDAKLALASDIGQLEASLHLVAPKENFDRPPKFYAEIRHFRQMLFLDEKGIVEKTLSSSFDPVITTQLLLSRISNRGVPITCVPYKALGKSVAKYNRWIDSQGTQPILKRFLSLVEELRRKVREGRALSQASESKANASLNLVRDYAAKALKELEMLQESTADGVRRSEEAQDAITDTILVS